LNGRYKVFCAVGDLDESRALLTQIRHQITSAGMASSAG
jgi:hypothetical protein